MTTPRVVVNQINEIIKYLVEVGLSGDQNFAILRQTRNDNSEVTFPQANKVSFALKNKAYAEIYNNLVQSRAYSVKMPDGALVQMMYLFVGRVLQRHRLAFFPAPHLEQFQNNPELYLTDEIYADIVAPSIVPFPVRFDYDTREGIHRDVTHPKSHLTLGQYQNCRIPVTAPLTPLWFTDFLLRNFYNTAFNRYAETLPRFADCFAESIVPAERNMIHLAIPTGVPA